MKFLLGKKQNMTRVFLESGDAIPVTAVAAGPCYVTAIKTIEKDGYSAVQIGYGKVKRLTKALAGHLKESAEVRHLREFRVDSTEGFEKGSMITVSTFAPGDKVTVVGTSKGKGFQGVVKRHGFGGSPASHGHKDQLRMPGSIGATDAARVFKGKRMGGHMGAEQVTVANLEIIDVDTENNILYIKGAIPGARGTFLQLRADGDLVFSESAASKAEAQEDVPVVDEIIQDDSVSSETTEVNESSEATEANVEAESQESTEDQPKQN